MTQADRQQEYAHLEQTLAIIREAVDALRARLFTEGDTLLEEKRRATEEFRAWEVGDDQADTAEYAFDTMQMSVDDRLRLNEQRKYQRYRRMLDKTYFGRVDWNDGLGEEPIYIGAHGYYDERRFTSLVCDWRAPIATLFYEYEKGPARFTAPDDSIIEGNITLKRQFDIKDGSINAMFDTDVRVLDAMLLEALSQDTSGAMHAIYSTLQREQYRLVRGAHASNMVIFGVAGSGKTSIALHRIAWLIYARKGALNCDNVRILSPNRLFSTYIAGVLPELGEGSVRTLSLDDIAADAVHAESRYAQLEYALSLSDPDNDERVRNIRRKSGAAFEAQLSAYMKGMFARFIEPADIKAAGVTVPAALIEDVFVNVLDGLTLTERAAALPGEIHRCVVALYNAARDAQYSEKLARDDERAFIRTAEVISDILPARTLREFNNALSDMVRDMDAATLYRAFLAEQGLNYAPLADGRVPNEDAFPLMLIMNALYGFDAYSDVAHLVVDEMQDYTPVQYRWIRENFACERTLLGDTAQHVQPLEPEITEDFFRALLGTNVSVHRLTKSYRSTLEIGRFCSGIIGLEDVEWVARHGQAPRVIRCAHQREQTQRVHAFIEEARAAGRSVAVLCKTQRDARALHARLNLSGLTLLDENSELIGSLFITAAYIAKGLEFDCVIVPDANAAHYHTALDKQQLYVACTRALHELTVTYTDELSPFIAR